MNIPSEKDSHFKFGENWDDYSRTITQNKIDESVRGLTILLDMDSLEGKIFLDIGCGSGIHALAALKMGAEKVVAVDLVP